MGDYSDVLATYLRVTQHMSRQFRSHFGRLHLTFPQALVLTILDTKGPMPISVLAEQTGGAKSTVSGVMDRLEKLGLARRERSGHDHRIIYVSATDKYRAMQSQHETDVGGYFATLLGTMTDGEKGEVRAALEKLDKALDRYEEKEAQA